MKFHIITVGRNVAPWLTCCLESAAIQQGQDFDVCVVDDASDDGSREIGREFCALMGWAHVAQTERKGGLFNQVHAIDVLAPAPEDVCVVLDADDRLEHELVLERLAQEYADPAVGLTYGSYRTEPRSSTCAMAAPYPIEVSRDRAFRRHPIMWNHLKSWRYEPFSRLDRNLRFKWPSGEWFDRGQDYAVVTPLLEMLGPNHRFIPDVLYVYTSSNPQSEWRVAPREIDRITSYILNDLPRQEPMV